MIEVRGDNLDVFTVDGGTFRSRKDILLSTVS